MADETDDLEYSETNVGSAQAQGVRKNISLKLKGKGRGRGRRGGKTRRASTKKTDTGVADEDLDEVINAPTEKSTSDKPFGDSNLDDVISKLETSSFSPMDRSFSEPLHQNQKLRWDHRVNLIGEKVIDPLIHCCEKCSLPILNYGRMIPCKHVCCYDCAKKCDKICPKCDEKVQRIEQSALGTVFMCNYGGGKHVPGACGRTYLSQRDLQAHVNHRHLKPNSTSTSASSGSSATHTAPPVNPITVAPAAHVPIARDPRDPRGHLHVDVSHQPLLVSHMQHSQDHRDAVEHARNPNLPMGSPVNQIRQYPHSPANYQTSIPVSSARPNLITVPIQDDGAAHSAPAPAPHIHPQAHAPQYTCSVTTNHPMPPLQHPPSNYATHGYQHPHPNPAPAYSQAPPLSTQTFSQPPPVVHHQPIHAPSGPIYSTPPPPVHHPPPATYTPPRGPQHPTRALPPQHFAPPASGGYEENPSYLQQWGPGNVPPPPPRTALPPRPITAPPPTANPNVPHIPPRGPADPAYRPPYYQ
ncbi:e3 ubiquitin-protein ligase Hakai [Caerostris darwini]|uniref:E3 ubiquitin-protein ligase Hakai n=1 Tax=Caerostris darwini TaxID=1538125 RepID=A0AAV4PL62_9ARAC|nr:e3 ubiquitin-protein ligase Hakai [Caerostris darwini]